MNVQQPDRITVRSLALTYRDSHEVPAHRHQWAQLLYARSGLIRVEAEGRVWLAPPTRAIWVPAETAHRFRVRGEVAFRTLYLAPGRAAAVGRNIGALEVSPLLSELILHVLSHGVLDESIPADERLAGVLADLIAAAPSIDLMLPLPADLRARRLADHFLAHPEDRTELARLAVGASVRTLQRCFATEVGMSIDVWRQKVRLVAAAAALSAGVSVTSAALGCGYDSPSAFIAAFKRQFAMTPRQFARKR